MIPTRVIESQFIEAQDLEQRGLVFRTHEYSRCVTYRLTDKGKEFFLIVTKQLYPQIYQGYIVKIRTGRENSIFDHKKEIALKRIQRNQAELILEQSPRLFQYVVKVRDKYFRCVYDNKEHVILKTNQVFYLTKEEREIQNLIGIGKLILELLTKGFFPSSFNKTIVDVISFRIFYKI